MISIVCHSICEQNSHIATILTDFFFVILVLVITAVLLRKENAILMRIIVRIIILLQVKYHLKFSHSDRRVSFNNIYFADLISKFHAVSLLESRMKFYPYNCLFIVEFSVSISNFEEISNYPMIFSVRSWNGYIFCVVEPCDNFSFFFVWATWARWITQLGMLKICVWTYFLTLLVAKKQIRISSAISPSSNRILGPSLLLH